MKNELIKVATPQWMLQLLKSIDDLDFSEGSGFQIFAADVVMQFGQETAKGIGAFKDFFVKLAPPVMAREPPSQGLARPRGCLLDVFLLIFFRSKSASMEI
jgi:hypothetical protein